jgi:two-component system sensor histidine kinase YesM
MLNKGGCHIFIKDEIDNTKAYIQIQQIMHDYSFDAIYKINEEILEYKMINVTLQPIVENAIEHGILNSRREKGRLVITGDINNGLIEFTIEDNGAGMSRELIDQIFTQNSRGYGLKNVHDRIRFYFGDEYGVSLKSEEGSGTLVRVTIPMYKNM